MTTTQADALAAFVAERGPRILTLCAPAGYGKERFLRAYARRAGSFALCDLGRRHDDVAGAVAAALVAGDAPRSARSALDRLARGTAPRSASRESLRREWASPDGCELLVLRDPAGALETPAGADLFGELVTTL
ncbi:MAG: hypothetical protein JO225_07960, partial [Candidatus Eremiobacteraeota bacterium]|nr:hypothetical protein [Candidatus Eremiobacteraeota bacterium]